MTELEADVERGPEEVEVAATALQGSERLSKGLTAEYLEHQLSWFDLEEPLRRMCLRIISNLDTNGYLESPLEELLPPRPSEENGDAQAWRDEQMELAEKTLAIVQRLDPPGVGARNLKECLLLQLTPGLLFYEELQTLIRDHLEDLENNRLPRIARKTGFSIEAIQE